MKLFFRKVLRVVLIGFVLIVLLLVGWLGYVFYLTIQNDRACGGQITMIKESNYTQNDEELQRVLDNYSAKKAGVGLQATVIFPDGTVWSGVSGYANHEKKCPLTLDHHLYIGSITKLYTATLVMEQVDRSSLCKENHGRNAFKSHQWYSQLHGRPLVSCAVVWFSKEAMATR